MIDTLNLIYKGKDGRNFLKEVSPYLHNPSERVFGENSYLIERHGNLNVVVSKTLFRIGEGSLCKYHLGDNLAVMRRQDIEDVVGSLSDKFHLPLDEARISRLDWAENLVMLQPVNVYLDHLGTPARGWRQRYSESCLYYHGMNGKTFCLYDKIEEMRGDFINSLWQGKNVLRLEQRYTKRLPHYLGMDAVTAKVLYNQRNYSKLTKMWKDDLLDIPVVNDIAIDLDKMKNVSDLHRVGTLYLIEKYGGQNAFLENIAKRQKEGGLTSKQAFDLRKAINDACKVKEGFVEQNEAMQELQTKIREVARYSR